MFLYIAVDDRTIKRNWDCAGCDVCLYRFECYTEDRATIRPVKVELSPVDSWYYTEHFKAEFHLPKCIRTGLFKQIADTGYWSNRYPTEFSDGFKLGGVFEDEGERIAVKRSWMKLPNIIYVTGLIG